MKSLKLLIVLVMFTAASTAFALGCSKCGCDKTDEEMMKMSDDVSGGYVSCGFPWIFHCGDECDRGCHHHYDGWGE